jgi:hypothetical protein
MSFKTFAQTKAPLAWKPRRSVFDITKDLKPGMRIRWRLDDNQGDVGTFVRYERTDWYPIKIWAIWDSHGHEGLEAKKPWNQADLRAITAI